MNRWGVALLALSGIVGTSRSSFGMSFVSGDPKTIRQQVSEAPIVFYARCCNARPAGPAGVDSEDGMTELHILRVIRDHSVLKGIKIVPIPRSIRVKDVGGPPRYLLLADVDRGKVDVYAGLEVTSNRFLDYVKGAIAFRGNDNCKALRFFSRYLGDPDPAISLDAYLEFKKASYHDFRLVGSKLQPAKILKLLENPETPAYRLGIYGKLLGHCGKEKHAARLRKVIHDPNERYSTSSYDGLLIGFTMLKPAEGWATIRQILRNAKEDFRLRYSALLAIDFFWDTRPDFVGRKNLLEEVCSLLDQNDLADMAIERLREHRQWQVAGRVLALADKKSDSSPGIRQAILRFALCCPNNPKAAAFIAAERKRDKENVQETEELLEEENATKKLSV
jgi:hypothetical protein